MRITDLLYKESILLNAAPKDKSEAIDMLVGLQAKSGRIKDVETYKKGILAREEMSSTAVGEGIAIPHAKSEAVAEPSLAAMTVPGGVDYEALDGEPSDLLFMIAAPNDGDVHLDVLSRLMTLLMDEDFRAKLTAAKDKDEFLSAIDEAEKAKYPDEPAKAAEDNNSDRIKVLAVTACPTGIAHTYMAADPLRVIPSCMIGAGVAGGLSMAFNCTLMAPHGGIFVFAVVGNWPMYLLALAAGSIVSMVILTLLKKKKTENKTK